MEHMIAAVLSRLATSCMGLVSRLAGRANSRTAMAALAAALRLQIQTNFVPRAAW